MLQAMELVLYVTITCQTAKRSPLGLPQEHWQALKRSTHRSRRKDSLVCLEWLSSIQMYIATPILITDHHSLQYKVELKRSLKPRVSLPFMLLNRLKGWSWRQSSCWPFAMFWRKQCVFVAAYWKSMLWNATLCCQLLVRTCYSLSDLY